MSMAEAEKLYEGTDALCIWHHWPSCPGPVQALVIDYITERMWTAAGRPSPMVMIQSCDRQVQQDVCKGWREHLDATFDCRTVVPFGERSIVVWFNQMPAPLTEG